MKYFAAFIALIPVVAHGQTSITRSEFEDRINRAATDQRYRESLLRSDGLDTLLLDPVADKSAKKPSVDNDSGKASSDTSGKPGLVGKGGGSGASGADNTSGSADQPSSSGEKPLASEEEKRAAEQAAAAKAAEVTAAAAEAKARRISSTNKKGSDDYYFPSGMSVEKTSSIKPVSFTFDENRTVFGISLGTSIPVRLRRTSTNVQPGYIELIITADITGRKKTLPAESILFAVSSVVKGSSRLYLNSVKGVTPNGEEFEIKGHISDHFNTAGLSGVIKSDGRAAARSLSQGGLALSRSLAGEISGDPLATGANAIANQLIKEGSDQASVSLDRAAFIVSASPQKGVLTVEETF